MARRSASRRMPPTSRKAPLASSLKGIEVHGYDYQPDTVRPKKRKAPLSDSLLPPATRVMTIGDYVERHKDGSHHIDANTMTELKRKQPHQQQQDRDGAEGRVPAVIAHILTADKGCQTAESQLEMPQGKIPGQEQDTRHHRGATRDMSAAQGTLAQDDIHAATAGYNKADSQQVNETGAMQQKVQQGHHQQTPAGEVSNQHITDPEDQIIFEQKKFPDVQSQLEAEKKRVGEQAEEIRQLKAALEEAQKKNGEQAEEIYQQKEACEDVELQAKKTEEKLRAAHARFKEVKSKLGRSNKKCEQLQTRLQDQISLSRDDVQTVYQEAVRHYEGEKATLRGEAKSAIERLEVDVSTQAEQIRRQNELANTSKNNHESEMSNAKLHISNVQEARRLDGLKHQADMHQKDAQINSLKRQLKETEEAKEKSGLENAILEGQLAEERTQYASVEDHENIKNQLNVYERRFTEMLRERDAAKESEARAKVKISTLEAELNDLNQRLNDFAERGAEIRNSLASVRQQKNDIDLHLAQLRRNQELRAAASGHGGHRKPEKESRATNEIGRTGNMNSRVLGRTGIGKSKQKHGSNAGKGVATSTLRNPAVSTDLCKLRKKGDLYIKKEAGLAAVLDKATDFDALIQGAKGMGLKGSGDLREEHELLEEDEHDMAEADVKEHRPVENMESLEEALSNAFADSGSKDIKVFKVVGDTVFGVVDEGSAKIAASDSQLSETMGTQDTTAGVDGGSQSDDELSVHDDDEFKLEEVADAFHNSR